MTFVVDGAEAAPADRLMEALAAAYAARPEDEGRAMLAVDAWADCVLAADSLPGARAPAGRSGAGGGGG